MLPALPTSAASARRFLRDRLNDWGCPLGAGETAALLVSELVTNAIVHAGQAIVELQLVLTGRRLRVGVGDTSAQAPQVRVGGPDDDTGRGLQMLDALAAEWGVESQRAGKLVWFEVDLDPQDGLGVAPSASSRRSSGCDRPTAGYEPSVEPSPTGEAMPDVIDLIDRDDREAEEPFAES